MDLKLIPLAIFVASYLLQINVADAAIGINWGRQNQQKLLPSNVVDLILQNGIHAARIFSTEEELLWAFADSGIDLTINIPSMRYGSFITIEQATLWTRARASRFKPSNVRQIYVADYSFSYQMGNKKVLDDVMQAIFSLQQAVNDEGFGDQIKVNMPQNRGILKINQKSLRPSEAEFIDEIKPHLTTLLRFLQQNHAPFTIALTPIGDISDFGVDFDFVFADNKSNFTVTDVNGAVYGNTFEIMYDSFVWALKKLNFSDMRVVVSEVGWPTDGNPGASAANAERFYRGLLPWVSGKKGTPMRPGAPIDIFIASLTDENRMIIYGGGTFTRHMGIYMSNGRPKYKIDLSGKGRDVYPAISKGIKRMPDRWCVFNGDRSNITKLTNQMNKACMFADCTAMAEGGSCSKLGYSENVTYAFNMYFQFQFQNETECDFEGLGHVSTEDPSTPECVFPVEVVRPEQQAYIQYKIGKGFFVRPNSAVFVILFSFLGTLLLWN